MINSDIPKGVREENDFNTEAAEVPATLISPKSGNENSLAD